MLLELIEHYNLLAEQMRIYEADKIPTGSIWLCKISVFGVWYTEHQIPLGKSWSIPWTRRKLSLGWIVALEISEELGQVIDPNCIYYQS